MTKLNSSFYQAINQLNQAQKKAVETIDGPVMVIAGPGTGKTQVLSVRIANILQQTDTDPRSILALTFTQSAAKNMRERLRQIIGTTAYYVQINTFHSFAGEIISRYPEYFSLDADSEPLNNLEKYQMFEQIIDNNDFELLRPLNRPYYYIRHIINRISDLKRENIDLHKYQELIDKEITFLKNNKDELKKSEINKQEKKIKKNQELKIIYQQYEEMLKQTKGYDFDDMISQVTQALQSNQDLLLEYQENLHYFLVDEYQDTNNAQNQLINLLTSYWGQKANIFVVGDPNQSIFRFQGASTENMLSFIKDYPQAQLICLQRGYRCPENIYQTAAQLIQNNKLALSDAKQNSPAIKQAASLLTQVIKNPDNKPSPIKVISTPSQIIESIFLAEDIKKHIKQGINPQQIAILYNKNKDSLEIIDTLAKWNIPFEIDGGINILEDPTIDQLFQVFQLILDLRSGEENNNLYEVLNYEWLKLDPLAVMKISRIAGKLRITIIDAIELGLEQIKKQLPNTQLTQKEYEHILKIINLFYELSHLEANQTFNTWFEVAIKKLGFLDWMMSQQDKIELLNNLNSLYREIKTWINKNHHLKLTEFLNTLNLLREHRISIQSEDLNIKDNSIHLSTVHKAKGQEWDYVYIIKFNNKKWGNQINRDYLPLPDGIVSQTDLSKKEQNEDDRRLFYVALTRAAKKCTITFPETIITENSSKDVSSSLFLDEIKDQIIHLSKKDKQKMLRKVVDLQDKLLQPPSEKKVYSNERKFFSQIIKNFKLSPTALNIYLRDPQDFVDNVLLRVPRAKNAIMSFGTAVHQSLEYFYKFLSNENTILDKQEFIKNFEKSLKQQILSSDEYKRRLKFGKKILDIYYDKKLTKATPPVFTERIFGTGFSTTILGDIPLSGRIDRVDWIDKTKKTVRVIDYKTGKPKTMGQIQGQTKDSCLSEREKSLPESIQGPYKRQLLFYKILCDLDKSFKPEVTHAQFDFVQPKKNSKLVTREIKIIDKEITDMKQLIKQIMSEIRDLEFLKQL